MTELDTANLMRQYLAERGVERYFHGPFVWFGERTMLSPHWSDAEFLPTAKALQSGMPLILDVAPIVDGYAADIGYATAFGTHPLLERLTNELAEIRDLIPLRINQGVAMDQIYKEIDQWTSKRGYVSCHHHYPAGVIGHLVGFTSSLPNATSHYPSEGMASTDDDRALAQGFGESAVRFLLGRKSQAKQIPSDSPYWNSRKESAHRPSVGVWAIEPHFGTHGVGVKFEEMLVVTADTCYWLDDDVPHVQRWRPHHPIYTTPSDEAIQCP
jgi:Xaa-Pro aminopeptidase